MGYADLPASREIIEADIENERRWMKEFPVGSRPHNNAVDNISRLIDRLEDPVEGDPE